MKSLIVIALFFASSYANAFANARSVPSFTGRLINYGSLPTESIQLTLSYDSHNGHDWGCADCFHQKFNIQVRKDGSFLVPEIHLDPNSNMHSFNVRLKNAHDRLLLDMVYSCDVENSKFEHCENVLQRDLSILSAYSFKGTPLQFSLSSGEQFQDWLKAAKDIYLRINVTRTEFTGYDELSWNAQIFGDCNVDQCELHSGAVIFPGGDYGPSPELSFKITATQFPKYSANIPGVSNKEITTRWNGDLPPSLSAYTITGQ